MRSLELKLSIEASLNMLRNAAIIISDKKGRNVFLT